jgi:hypothetical protein
MVEASVTERANAAARKIKELQAKRDELDEQIEDYKQFIANNLPKGESVLGDEDTGFVKVTVYQSKQYNEAYGKRNHPELWDQYAVTIRALPSAEAKKAMPPEEYELFQKPSDKISVKVEVIND